MKKLITFAALMLLPSMIMANTISVKINGMVCAFCAQGIEKKFKSEASVKEVKVSLDTKIVKIGLKENQTLGAKRIKEIIVDAGYEVEEINGLKPNQTADTGTN